MSLETRPGNRGPGTSSQQDPHSGQKAPRTVGLRFPTDKLQKPTWKLKQRLGKSQEHQPLDRCYLKEACGAQGARHHPTAYPALRREWSPPRRSAPPPGCPGPCRWTSGPGTGPVWRNWRAGKR